MKSNTAFKCLNAAALSCALLATPFMARAGILENVAAKVVEHQVSSRINDAISGGGKPSATATGQGGFQGGKVVYVDDGDTVIVLTASNEQVKVRLASIDAPESSHTNKETGRIGQPFNEPATRFLSALVKGKMVSASCPDHDRYGRQVCDLTVDGINVNAELVRNGWAWANTAANGRYLRDKTFLRLQEEAQARRIGLWAGARPIPPWEWRSECWQKNNCPN
ncbi:thermonuclease family protein [Paucibacter soli]|uniref:thermonuclease family protein n=1 Tax=Paucibacter soli TaxID=3133433 RepID=UPI0030971A5A